MNPIDETKGPMDPAERHLTHNRLCNATGEGLWGMLSGLITTATVLPALLIKLEASDLERGALTAFELCGFLLPGVFGVYYLADLKNYKKYLVLYHVYICCPLLVGLGLLVQFSAALPNAVVSWSLVCGFGVFSASIGFIAPTWFHWLAALFPAKHRGVSLSFAVGFSAVSSAAATFLASEVIEGKYIAFFRDNPLEYPLNFSLLFYGSAVLGAISMVCFWLVREPTAIPHSGVRREWADLMAKFRLSMAEPNFQRFLFGRTLEYMALTFLGFYTYYFMSQEGGGLSDGEVTLYGAITPIMTALFGFIAGSLGDRFGHKLGKVIGMVWMTASFGLILLPTGSVVSPEWVPVWVLAIFALRGLFFGSMFSGFNFIFESCPHESLAAHITVINLIVSIFAGIAGVLAGKVVEWYGYQPLFWLGFGMSSISFLWYIFAVKDPRKMPPHAPSFAPGGPVDGGSGSLTGDAAKNR